MKQKTLFNADVDKLDEQVCEFQLTHNVKASQSYYGNGNHYRVLFFD